MKFIKNLLAASLLGLLVFSTANAYTFTTNLSVGSAGDEVIALQDFLISKGHLVWPAGADKGFFGAVTQTALKAWQVSNNILPADGYFGPVSRAFINANTTEVAPVNYEKNESNKDSMFVDVKANGLDNVTLKNGDNVEYTIDAKGVDKVQFWWRSVEGGSTCGTGKWVGGKTFSLTSKAYQRFVVQNVKIDNKSCKYEMAANGYLGNASGSKTTIQDLLDYVVINPVTVSAPTIQFNVENVGDATYGDKDYYDGAQVDVLEIYDTIPKDKLPTITWKTENAVSFDGYIKVNDANLCGGVKNGTDFKAIEKASGSFKLTETANNRIGCEMKLVLVATSKSGVSATKFMVLSYEKKYPESTKDLITPVVKSELIKSFDGTWDRTYKISLNGGTSANPVKKWSLNFTCPSSVKGIDSKPVIASCGADYILGTTQKNGDASMDLLVKLNDRSASGKIPFTVKAFDKDEKQIGMSNAQVIIDSLNQSSTNTIKSQIDIKANGQDNLTVKEGDVVNYTWKGAGLKSYSTYQTVNGTKLCNGSSGDWLFNSKNNTSYVNNLMAAGEASDSYPGITVIKEWEGCTWTVKATAIDIRGDKLTDTMVITYPKTTSVNISKAELFYDVESLATNNPQPTITGTSKNLTTNSSVRLGFALMGTNGDKIWSNGNVSVVNNKWSVKIDKPLVVGKYKLVSYINSSEKNRVELVIHNLTTMVETVAPSVNYEKNESNKDSMFVDVKANGQDSVTLKNGDNVEYTIDAKGVDKVQFWWRTIDSPACGNGEWVGGKIFNLTNKAYQKFVVQNVKIDNKSCKFEIAANGYLGNASGSRTTIQDLLDYVVINPASDTSTGTTTSMLNRTLKVGDEGSDVAVVQETLKKKGFFSEEITGFFGNLTSKAVSAFQQANALEAVGEVGPKTKSLLNSLLGN